MFKKTSFGQNLSKIYRTSIEHQWDIYRCLSMPMHSHGCLWMSTDIRRKSKITDLASIEHRKSNYSTFFFPPRLFFSPARVQQSQTTMCSVAFFFFFFSRLWWPTKSHMLPLVWPQPYQNPSKEIFFRGRKCSPPRQETHFWKMHPKQNQSKSCTSDRFYYNDYVQLETV